MASTMNLMKGSGSLLSAKWNVLPSHFHKEITCYRYQVIRCASKSSRKSQKKKRVTNGTTSENETLAALSQEYKQLRQLYPNPKGILNNVVGQATKNVVNKAVVYKTKVLPGPKKTQGINKSILALTWPKEIEVEGFGIKKKDAELMAAAQACVKLKDLGLIDAENKPNLPGLVMYKKDDIRSFLRQQNQPEILELGSDVKEELSHFLLKLQQNERNEQPKHEEDIEDHNIYQDSLMLEEQHAPIHDLISDRFYQSLSPSRRNTRNGVLLQRLINMGSNSAIADIQRNVKQLPINPMREEILSIINESQVTVLCGETGCGKTTQVPQFLLDDWIRQDMGSRCNIIMTQPRRISAISTAERIAKERGERVGQTVGYQIRLHRRSPENHGCVLTCTTGILLKKLQQNPDLKGISHVIVDEVHERDINTDFLLILLKSALKRNKHVKLILMSASINPGLFSQYFDDCPIINVPGFMYPVEEFFLRDALSELGIRENRHRSPLFREEESKDGKKKRRIQKAPPTNVDLVVDVIRQIDANKPPGAILCFLPGWQDIRGVRDKLQEKWGQGGDHCVYPVHSHVTVDNQQAIFEVPPEGVRKVVLATNIAETSITIRDVVYVVNTGTHKEEQFDSDLGVSCLDLHWTSKANIRQRKGRAGRRQPGECYHLFDKDVYNRMSEFQTAEMLRIPLEQIVVQAKVHDDSMQAEEFLSQAIEAPPPAAVSSALDLLQDLAILDEREQLTLLGEKISSFGCDPRIAKALVYAAIFRCVDPVLTIGASLCMKDPFRENLDNRKLIMEKMQEYSQGSESDHLVRLAVYRGWEEQKSLGHRSASDYVQSNHLYLPTLQFIRGLRRQFATNLEEAGMVTRTEDCFDATSLCNENSKDMEMIKAVLCSAFYPNLLKARYGKHEKGKLKPNKLVFKDLDSNNVLLHRKSINCAKQALGSRWLTYFSKMRSEITFIRDCTVVHPLTVVAFAGSRVFVDKLHSRDRKELLSRDLPDDTSPSQLVKLVIDDEQVALASESDANEFSPWEGLPISFYTAPDTAKCVIAFLKALERTVDDCLQEDAFSLSEAKRFRHSATLYMLSRLLHVPVTPSQRKTDNITDEAIEQVEQHHG